jgi:hypothetical protein
MGASTTRLLLLRRVFLPLVALVALGLLAGLLVIAYNDMQSTFLSQQIPTFHTVATCAVAITGVAILWVIALTILKAFNLYPDGAIGTILLLTGGLFGLVEAGITMDIIVLERINPLQFSLSDANKLPIMTRTIVWAVANVFQLGFYIFLFTVIRIERKSSTLRSVPGRRGMNGDGATSHGSQSVLSMVMEKSLTARQLPMRPPTPPTPMRLERPSAFEEWPSNPSKGNQFAQEFSTYPGNTATEMDVISPVSNHKYTPSQSSWRTSINKSLAQVGQPGNARVMMPENHTARSSVSLMRPSTDSRALSMTNSFDEYWDHATPPEVQIKDMFSTSSPSLATLRVPNAIASPSPNPSTLETIPGSRSASPSRSLAVETPDIGSSSSQGYSQTSLGGYSTSPHMSSASSVSTITPTIEQTSTFTPFHLPASHSIQRPPTAVSVRSFRSSTTHSYNPPQTSHSSMTTSTAFPSASTSRPTTAYSTNTMTTVTTATPSNRRLSNASRPPTPQSSYASLNSHYSQGSNNHYVQYSQPISPISPPVPISSQSHIHPLFRSDSPTPGPIKTSPNTVVTASHFSGQVIGHMGLPGASPPPVPPRSMSRQGGKKMMGQTLSSGPIPQFILEARKG